MPLSDARPTCAHPAKDPNNAPAIARTTLYRILLLRLLVDMIRTASSNAFNDACNAAPASSRYGIRARNRTYRRPEAFIGPMRIMPQCLAENLALFTVKFFCKLIICNAL